MKEQILFYEQKLQYEFDSWDLKDAFSKGAKVIAVDTRSAETFQKEHIPGAINIPHRTMTAESTSHLDKSILYVSYCDGIGCNASTKGALTLVKLGFQVKELMGGIDWWKQDGYPTEGTNANQSKVIACGC